MPKHTDCRPTTPEEKRQAHNARNLADYHANMADPAFRKQRASAARRKWADGEGARRNAAERAATAKIQAHRAETAPPPLYGPPVRECSPERVAYKREWRRRHAAELNARRQADRQAQPEHYRQIEQAQNKRRAAEKKAAKVD